MMRLFERVPWMRGTEKDSVSFPSDIKEDDTGLNRKFSMSKARPRLPWTGTPNAVLTVPLENPNGNYSSVEISRDYQPESPILPPAVPFVQNVNMPNSPPPPYNPRSTIARQRAGTLLSSRAASASLPSFHTQTDLILGAGSGSETEETESPNAETERARPATPPTTNNLASVEERVEDSNGNDTSPKVQMKNRLSIISDYPTRADSNVTQRPRQNSTTSIARKSTNGSKHYRSLSNGKVSRRVSFASTSTMGVYMAMGSLPGAEPFELEPIVPTIVEPHQGEASQNNFLALDPDRSLTKPSASSSAVDGGFGGQNLGTTRATTTNSPPSSPVNSVNLSQMARIPGALSVGATAAAIRRISNNSTVSNMPYTILPLRIPGSATLSPNPQDTNPIDVNNNTLRASAMTGKTDSTLTLATLTSNNNASTTRISNAGSIIKRNSIVARNSSLAARRSQAILRPVIPLEIQSFPTPRMPVSHQGTFLDMSEEMDDQDVGAVQQEETSEVPPQAVALDTTGPPPPPPPKDPGYVSRPRQQPHEQKQLQRNPTIPEILRPGRASPSPALSSGPFTKLPKPYHEHFVIGIDSSDSFGPGNDADARLPTTQSGLGEAPLAAASAWGTFGNDNQAGHSSSQVQTSLNTQQQRDQRHDWTSSVGDIPRRIDSKKQRREKEKQIQLRGLPRRRGGRWSRGGFGRHAARRSGSRSSRTRTRTRRGSERAPNNTGFKHKIFSNFQLPRVFTGGVTASHSKSSSKSSPGSEFQWTTGPGDAPTTRFGNSSDVNANRNVNSHTWTNMWNDIITKKAWNNDQAAMDQSNNGENSKFKRLPHLHIQRGVQLFAGCGGFLGRGIPKRFKSRGSP